jgi:5'-methylthioadenosine phosphorylase
MSIAFIGGTGLYRLPGLELECYEVTTRWGTVALRRGAWHGQEVLFLARHGEDHGVPPHAIDYRANLAALKAAGAHAVVATSAVGSLTPHLPPGTLALLTDFIDQTSGRARTFFDTEVVHLDSSVPYCPGLRAALTAAAQACWVELHPGAVYLCTNGPRFETPAEIHTYARWGAELVGMTNVPEVVLARELELCYAAVAVVTNFAAGMAGKPLTHGEVETMMADRLADLGRLLETLTTQEIPTGCACGHALAEYRARRGEAEFGVAL